MLYDILKFPAKLASWIFLRKVKINNREILNIEGPVLIAANHPNSFLDAIILSTLFKAPIHSLARGDVFKKPWIAKLLGKMHMLPVYRVSEGVENLEDNYKTFSLCKDIFRKGGLVLIFSEGACVNEWHLRPLKKGTARLALSSWQDGIPLKILPLGINYSSFRRFGKNLELDFGNIITSDDLRETSEGKRIQEFNNKLKLELQPLIAEMPKTNKNEIRDRFYKPVSMFTKALLFIPAILGFLFHAPLYLPVKSFTKKAFNDNDHYDSVVTALLFLSYPIYLLAISLIVCLISGSWLWLLLLVGMPLCARAYVEVKRQMD